MKYVSSEQILNKLDDIMVLFKELSKESFIKAYLNMFSHYVENAAPIKIRKPLVEKIRSWEKREELPEVSQLFQMLKSEGREEGIKEGMKKGTEKGKMEDAQRMLQKGMSKELIQEITGLPDEKIDELGN